MLMAWIAFACVPAMLVVMLAMGHLEARLLPPSPAQPGPGLPPVHHPSEDVPAEDVPRETPARPPDGLGDDPVTPPSDKVGGGSGWEIPAAAISVSGATAGRREARA
jgi:hypothetical protein